MSAVVASHRWIDTTLLESQGVSIMSYYFLSWQHKKSKKWSKKQINDKKRLNIWCDLTNATWSRQIKILFQTQKMDFQRKIIWNWIYLCKFFSNFAEFGSHLSDRIIYTDQELAKNVYSTIKNFSRKISPEDFR